MRDEWSPFRLSISPCFDTAMDTGLGGKIDNQGTRFGGGLEDEEVRLTEDITREGWNSVGFGCEFVMVLWRIS